MRLKLKTTAAVGALGLAVAASVGATPAAAADSAQWLPPLQAGADRWPQGFLPATTQGALPCGPGGTTPFTLRPSAAAPGGSLAYGPSYFPAGGPPLGNQDVTTAAAGQPTRKGVPTAGRTAGPALVRSTMSFGPPSSCTSIRVAAPW